MSQFNSTFKILTARGPQTVCAVASGLMIFTGIDNAIQKIAKNRFSNSTKESIAGLLSLGWLIFVATRKTPLQVAVCVVFSFIFMSIFPKPVPKKSSQPAQPKVVRLPPGWVDLIQVAKNFEEKRLCIKDDLFIKAVETVLRHPSKRSILLVSESIEDGDLYWYYLCWAIAHRKLSDNSSLYKIKVITPQNAVTIEQVPEVINYCESHRDSYLLINQKMDISVANQLILLAQQRLIGLFLSDSYLNYQNLTIKTEIVSDLWHVQIANPNTQEWVKIDRTGAVQKSLPQGLFDMTQEAQNYPEWGYEFAEAKNLKHAVQTFVLRRDQKSLMLVGKSTEYAVKYLARVLKDLQIVEFNLDWLLSSSLRDEYQLEEKIKRIIKFLKKNPKALCYISRADRLVGDHSKDRTLNLQAVSHIKKALLHGGVRVIGAITAENFEIYCDSKDQRQDVVINSNGYLIPRLQEDRFYDQWLTFKVAELAPQDCLNRVMAMKPQFAKNYPGLEVSSSAILAAVVLAEILQFQRSAIDVVLDLIEQGAAEARLNQYEIVEAGEVIRGAITLQMAPSGSTQESLTEKFQEKSLKLALKIADPAEDDDVL